MITKDLKYKSILQKYVDNPKMYGNYITYSLWTQGRNQIEIKSYFELK